MKQILVATDFSQHAEKALGRAVLLATEHQAALDILHVITPASVDALCDFLPGSRHAVEENLTNSFIRSFTILSIGWRRSGPQQSGPASRSPKLSLALSNPRSPAMRILSFSEVTANILPMNCLSAPLRRMFLPVERDRF